MKISITFILSPVGRINVMGKTYFLPNSTKCPIENSVGYSPLRFTYFRRLFLKLGVNLFHDLSVF